MLGPVIFSWGTDFSRSLAWLSCSFSYKKDMFFFIQDDRPEVCDSRGCNTGVFASNLVSVRAPSVGCGSSVLSKDAGE